MKTLPTLLLALSSLLLPCSRALAWSGAGHQVIAGEAYRQLSSALKTKVAEILKAHPDYEKWKESFTSESATLDLATFIFMRSSTWADEMRRRGNQYNHPQWHYFNYPLRPPKFPVEPGPNPTDDILYGISQCEKTLADTKATPEERAVYLSWLIHLVGDVHMPLHCCSLFTSEYPTGDKGRNLFFIRPATNSIPLHSFWDGHRWSQAHNMPIQKSDGTAPVVARLRATPVRVVVRDPAVVGGIVARVVKDPAARLFRGGFGHTQEWIGGVDRLGAGIGYVGDAGRFGNGPAHTRPLRVGPGSKVAAAEAEVHAIIRDAQIGGACGVLLDELIEGPAADRTKEEVRCLLVG